MRSSALHGVTLAWTCAAGVPDLVAELGLDAGLGAPTGRGRVEITIRPGDGLTSNDPAAEGFLPSFFHGIVQAYRAAPGKPAGFVLWDRNSRVLVPDGGSRVDVFVGPNEIVPGSARASLEIALSLALREEGLHHLHAAALVRPEGASIVIVGGSGAGKTTATIALIEAGYAFLGDDALLVEESREGPRLCAFPRPFHVGPRTLAAFPRLAPHARARASAVAADKRDLDPDLAFPGKRLPTCAAPRLVLHPRVEPDLPTELSPLPKSDALGNLLASSGGLVIDGPSDKKAHLALLGALVNGARHLDLRLGVDLLHDPSILARAVGKVRLDERA
jgi:hypothetical protein